MCRRRAHNRLPAAGERIARLPSDLAVIGDDVALHERPPVDPSAVDVAIDILRPPSRFPIGLHGIAHAKRCPPLR